MAARPHRTETVEPAGVAPDRPRRAPAPTRLLAQRGLFFGPSALVPEDLYAVVSAARRAASGTGCASPRHSAVSTNTYFGRFHATYWQRWTAVGEVEVTARVSGTGRVRLMASDTNKVWRIVAAQDVADADGLTVRLVAAIDRFVDGGGLWLEITTETGRADRRRRPLDGGRAAPAAHRRRGDLHLQPGRRLPEHARRAGGRPGAGEAVESVVVVDQGSDPLESRPRFAEVGERLGPRLRYVRQPNLGGAGGFTRGLFDATAGDRPTTTTSC